MRQKGALILLILLLLFLPMMSGMTQNGENLLLQKRLDRPFQGVVEIWLCETFAPGRASLTGWVNQAVKRYEKANPGVYIRVRTVQESVARSRLDAKDALPDAILCGAGVVTGEDALLACQQGAAAVFTRAVSQNGVCYAYPVAAGAYTILYQQQALDRAGIVSPTQADLTRFGKSADGRGTLPVILCGADRLTCPAAAFEALMPQAQQEALHPDYGRRTLKEAWADFVLDQASVGYVCTQKEVFRIRQLVAGGSAFEWGYDRQGCAYTDQLLALYLPDTGADAARTGAVQAFGALLQSEQMQQLLADYGAFSVTGLTLYQPDACMGAMEQGLARADLAVPNLLSWREAALLQYDQMSASSDPAQARQIARAVLKQAQPPSDGTDGR